MHGREDILHEHSASLPQFRATGHHIALSCSSCIDPASHCSRIATTRLLVPQSTAADSYNQVISAKERAATARLSAPQPTAADSYNKVISAKERAATARLLVRQPAAAAHMDTQVEIPAACEALCTVAKSLRDALELARKQHPGVHGLYGQLKESHGAMRAAVHYAVYSSDWEAVQAVQGAIQQLTEALVECRSEVWEWLLLMKCNQVFNKLDIPALLTSATVSLSSCMQQLSAVAGKYEAMQYGNAAEVCEAIDDVLKGLSELVDVPVPAREAVRTYARANRSVVALKCCDSNDDSRLTHALKEVESLVLGSDSDQQAALDAGAVPALVTLLTSSNIWAKEAVTKSLISMTRTSDSTLQRFRQAGLIPALVSLLKSEEDTDETKYNAARVLHLLAQRSEAVRPDMVRAGVAGALHDVLNSDGSSDEVKAAVAWTLWGLCGKVVTSTHVAEGLAAGAVLALVSLLHSSTCEEAQARALAAVGELSASNESNVEISARAGVIPAMVAVLRTSGSDTIRKQAVSSLQKLVNGSPDHLAALSEAGGIPALVGCIKSGVPHKALAPVVTLLTYICSTSPQHRSAIADAGAVPAILQVFDTSNCGDYFMGDLVWLLAYVAAGHVESQCVVVESGALAGVAAALEGSHRFKSDAERMAVAIPLLQLCGDNIGGVVESIQNSRQGIPDATQPAGFNPSVLKAEKLLVELLTRLCSDSSACKAAAIQAGAVSALVALFKTVYDCHEGSGVPFKVLDEIAKALAHVTADDPVSQQGVADGGILPLVAALLNARMQQHTPQTQQAAEQLVRLCTQDMAAIVAWLSRVVMSSFESIKARYKQRPTVNKFIALLHKAHTSNEAAWRDAIHAGIVPVLIRWHKEQALGHDKSAWLLVDLSCESPSTQEAIVQAGILHDVVSCTVGRDGSSEDDQLPVAAGLVLKKMCADAGCEACAHEPLINEP